MQEEWDKELNIVYQKIMKIANTKTKNNLRNAQRAWLKSRDKKVQDSYYFENPEGGSMGVLFSLYKSIDKKLYFTRKRGIAAFKKK